MNGAKIKELENEDILFLEKQLHLGEDGGSRIEVGRVLI